MNFYIYVNTKQGGRFLAATVNERRAITAVVIGLKETYKPEGFDSADVFEDYYAFDKAPIHSFKF